ncbi:MAG: extracellular solute-binding protein [Oscillospiraceae bacterium]|nr:extracellular solute-binding protein [Oscillospiraceae bacterium]
MKTNWRRILAVLLSAIMLLSLVACGDTSSDSGSNSGSDNSANTDSSSDVDTSSISITVWCPEAAVDLTTSQLAAYNEANGTSINFTVEAVGEGEAATNMITDVTAGADIYFFAQDQLARLVQAGALTQVSSSLSETITSENDAGSVAAATVSGSIYAFPLTADNGYFVYYDKSVITDESVLEDQTALIEAVSAAGKTIAFELTDSGWYAASYFFATGCVSDWSTDDDGTFTGYTDTFNSDAGIAAAKGMAELVNSSVFVNSSSAASFSSDAAVVVTGTWDYATASEALGDNLGCTDLWSFTVDGETYHLGSYSGYKLLGVKPQTDATKAAYCQSVAAYLSSEECQQERFDTLGWGPSNVAVQASDAVQEDVALAALSAQNEYSTPQGQYPNAWWDTSKAIGASIQALGTTDPSDSDLQSILDTYTAGIESILSSASTACWVIVGDMDVSWSCTGGENGEYLLTENQVESDDPYVGIWEYDITVTGESGFRVVMYGAWDAGDYDASGIGYSHLADGSVGTEGGDNNIVVDPGSYHVTLDTTGDAPVITVVAN